MSESADLLAWYERVRRELPWRATSDPYLILVSEVMLQQTRVATAVPHFLRFVARFPTARALAAAPAAEVLAAWSGLGYYRRARLLHRAAQGVAERDGGFPRTARELEALPGIGPYTAAAVASIAFGECVAVLDGNVERVLARRLALPEPVERAASRRALRAAAQGLLEPSRPGESNQALMELGATVCGVQAPRCGECPLAAGCAAREQGRVEAFPVRIARRAREHQRQVSALVVREGRLLVFRRGDEEELLAGFWELPTVAAGRHATGALASRYGGKFVLGASLGSVRHGVTFRTLEIELRLAAWEPPCDEVAEGAEAAWFTPEELAAVPRSAGLRKAVEIWTAAGRPEGRS